jgi:hypothetical protein
MSRRGRRADRARDRRASDDREHPIGTSSQGVGRERDRERARIVLARRRREAATTARAAHDRAERELLDVLDAAARRLLREQLEAEARDDVTHAISGELYDELLHGTSLDDGTSEQATWGYGSARCRHRGARDGACRREAQDGVGHRVTMTGSLDAWRAIADYARDRGEMERRSSATSTRHGSSSEQAERTP